MYCTQKLLSITTPVFFKCFFACSKIVKISRTRNRKFQLQNTFQVTKILFKMLFAYMTEFLVLRVLWTYFCIKYRAKYLLCCYFFKFLYFLKLFLHTESLIQFIKVRIIQSLLKFVVYTIEDIDICL